MSLGDYYSIVTLCVVRESQCTKVTSFQLRAFIWIFIIVIVISSKMYLQTNTFHKPIILFRMTAMQFMMCIQYSAGLLFSFQLQAFYASHQLVTVRPFSTRLFCFLFLFSSQLADEFKCLINDNG